MVSQIKNELYDYCSEPCPNPRPKSTSTTEHDGNQFEFLSQLTSQIDADQNIFFMSETGLGCQKSIVMSDRGETSSNNQSSISHGKCLFCS
jgi:hypothetical protein